MKQGATAGGESMHDRLPSPMPVWRAVTDGPAIVTGLVIIVPALRKPITSQSTESRTPGVTFTVDGNGVASAYALPHSATCALTNGPGV